MACQITVGVERCFLRLLASCSGQLGYRVGLKEQRQPRATGSSSSVWLPGFTASQLPRLTFLATSCVSFRPEAEFSWLVLNWTFGSCFDSYILIFSKHAKYERVKDG